jgi:hypothetical protein
MGRPSALKSSFTAAIMLNLWAIEAPDDHLHGQLPTILLKSVGISKAKLTNFLTLTLAFCDCDVGV